MARGVKVWEGRIGRVCGDMVGGDKYLSLVAMVVHVGWKMCGAALMLRRQVKQKISANTHTHTSALGNWCV